MPSAKVAQLPGEALSGGHIWNLRVWPPATQALFLGCVPWE